MHSPSSPASTPRQHPASPLPAFLLGFGLAFAWLVLLFLQILAEPVLGLLPLAEWIGLSPAWLELLLAILLFALILGLTLRLLPRFRPRRPLACLIVGWVGSVVTLFVLMGLWFRAYGGLVIVGAG